MMSLVIPPDASPEKRAAAEAVNSLVLAAEEIVHDHPHPWDAFVFVWTLSTSNGTTKLVQTDPIFYHEGKPASFGNVLISAQEKFTLKFLNTIAPDRNFSTAVVTLTHARTKDGSNASIYFDNDATPLLISPETWWDVAERLNPSASGHAPSAHAADARPAQPLPGDDAFSTLYNYLIEKTREHIAGYNKPWDGYSVLFHVVNNGDQAKLARIIPFFYREGTAFADYAFGPDDMLDNTAVALAEVAFNGDFHRDVLIVLKFRADTGSMNSMFISDDAARNLWVTDENWSKVAAKLTPFVD